MKAYNIDCVAGCQQNIDDSTVDLIITDPPFAINTVRNHPTYNRKKENVITGYVEVPLYEYDQFTNRWMSEAYRILKPTGSMYVISGWSNLNIILNQLIANKFTQLNHVIWKYQFGVRTAKKYVTSHYHILYVVKEDCKSYTFNKNCRFSDDDRDSKGRSLRYADMEDVWIIPREYKPGQKKNRNQLPSALLEKMISYSSNGGDLIVDLFAGSFSTCKVADKLGRKSIGFEINPNMFLSES